MWEWLRRECNTMNHRTLPASMGTIEWLLELVFEQLLLMWLCGQHIPRYTSYSSLSGPRPSRSKSWMQAAQSHALLSLCTHQARHILLYPQHGRSRSMRQWPTRILKIWLSIPCLRGDPALYGDVSGVPSRKCRKPHHQSRLGGSPTSRLAQCPLAFERL